MNFQVPQYVELEDKLAFRLTLKQLGWFALGGFILFIVWTIFERWVFWITVPIVVSAMVAFAFYRPAGMSLIVFLVNGFKHLINPKKMTWMKGEDDITLVDKYGKPEIDDSVGRLREKLKQKQKDISTVEGLAKILDEKSDL